MQRRSSTTTAIPVEVVALIAIAIGLGLGLVNGLLVAVGRIPAIIATLATLAIYRGIDAEITGGENITAYQLPESLPATSPRRSRRAFPRSHGSRSASRSSGAAMLRWAPWARDFYAIGSNPDAARFAGIPSGRRVITAFAISGALAGLGGFMFASRFPTLDAVAANGFELDVITAVVIGGVNVFGGSGTVLGVVIGAVLVATISGRLHAAPARRVLEDLLQRLRDRRRGDDRRTRHQATPGSAAAADGPRCWSLRASAGRSVTGSGRIAAPPARPLGDAARRRDRRRRHLERDALAVLPDAANLLDLVTPYVFIGLMAFGLTFVVIAGEIDISVVSTLAVFDRLLRAASSARA